MRIKLTLPSEINQEAQNSLFPYAEPDQLTPGEVSINGRTSYTYECMLDNEDIDGINTHEKNIVNILRELTGSHYTHLFELELTVRNLGLNADIGNLLIFNVTEEAPENYVCRALRAAFIPCEDYENADVRQIAFSKHNEKLMDALKWLERTEKPDLCDVASIEENIGFGGDVKFLDENAIEAAIQAAQVNAATAHVMRKTLSSVIDTVERLYEIHNPFFLGWLHEHKSTAGTFVPNDYGIENYFGTTADNLQSLLDEFYEIPLEKRYENYYDGRTREQRTLNY